MVPDEQDHHPPMLTTIRLFFRNKEANPYLVVLCLLLASISESIGISTLLPVIAMASGGESANSNAIAQYAGAALGLFGIPASFGVLVFMVALLISFAAGITYVALAYAARAGAKVAMGLRSRLLMAVFNARWGYFSDKKSGGISNLIGGEAGKAGEHYVVSANVMASLIEATAFAVIALFMNWKLALAAAGFGLFMALVLNRFVKQARKASYRQTDRTTALLSDMVDAIANIKPLKTMHRYQPIIDGVNRTFHKLRKAAVRRELAKAGLAQGGAAFFAIIACGALYVAKTVLDVPFADLLVSALVLNKVVSAVSKSQRLNQMASLLESSQVRTLELIEEAEANREHNHGRKPPVIGAGCRFEQVDFAHGDRQILRGVSLEIPANAITVLNGPSGAGKTTIIDLLIGLHRPASGRSSSAKRRSARSTSSSGARVWATFRRN